MDQACKRLADYVRFQSFILLVIVFNAILVGTNTLDVLQPHLVTPDLINNLVLTQLDETSKDPGCAKAPEACWNELTALEKDNFR